MKQNKLKQYITRRLKNENLYIDMINDIAFSYLINSINIFKIETYLHRRNIFNIFDHRFQTLLKDIRTKHYFNKDICVKIYKNEENKFISYLKENGFIWCNDEHFNNIDFIFNKNNYSYIIINREDLTCKYNDTNNPITMYNEYSRTIMTQEEFYIFFDKIKKEMYEKISLIIDKPIEEIDITNMLYYY